MGAPTLPLDARSVVSAWSVIGSISGGRSELTLWDSLPSTLILEACWQILKHGAIHQSEWNALTRGIPELSHLRGELEGPREDRLSLFERAVKALPRSQKTGNATAEFLCGYLASCISPGTLDHINILLPYLDTLPSLLLWYGLCAGLLSSNSLESEFDGLIRRVKRELLRDDYFLQSPSCDISFAELEVISASARDLTDMRVSATGLLVVELFPCVNAQFRLRQADGVSEAPSGLTASILDDLSDSLDRTRDLIDRFRRVTAIGRGGALDFDKGKKGKPAR